MDSLPPVLLLDFWWCCLWLITTRFGVKKFSKNINKLSIFSARSVYYTHV